MKETSPDPPDIDRKRSSAIPKAPSPSLNEPANNASDSFLEVNVTGNPRAAVDAAHEKLVHNQHVSLSTLSGHLAAAPSPQDERQGSVLDPKPTQDSASNNTDDENGSIIPTKKGRGFIAEVRRTFHMALTYSWLNVLLVFVPIGIVVANVPGVHGGIVFAMNCIAVIPLAGLLSFATESVACNMGDSLGALLNVTFGNAVELIIFIIALVKNQIRIVQASLLGSILANLLLILGMGFFLGGLRYREQIYNSTVTQMSACLLSLSVISLVLPTAFHASFNNAAQADKESLKISRGTSVILLLVYVIYLLFQLKSHAYMYESTPQHIVDAESIPGPAAAWLDTSSSDDSSSSSSDSDSSGHSRDTMRRKMKQVLRKGRKRKSSSTSSDTGDTAAIRNSSLGNGNASALDEATSESSSSRPHLMPRIPSTETNDEAVEDEKSRKRSKRHRLHRHRRRHRRHRHDDDACELQPTISERPETGLGSHAGGEPRRVDFAVQDELIPVEAAVESAALPGPSRLPFPILRGVSVKSLAPTVFVQKPVQHGATPQASVGPVPRVRSLTGANGAPGGTQAGKSDEGEHLSRVASIILLLLTTGLVAVCAEFLVGSIEAVTKTSTVGEVFIGLIILPIVGNAAEHVTAITVAMKNKMDLAIGVAVGSSIQIALFVTPLVVILGWIIGRDMTLYFTLFETVSLFVSAFMVNFLVLDGRSNYLEGALLCAVYIIIAIVAFFFPSEQESSAWGV
ncbi:sodium/calcium exchanger protein [Hirsutella rhossiliensis]|uniref:Sodium/calcium exchanger protein n=1 Tax=Hirsutella rhossiliensis TaxID=111463 RepID=A0A9P8MWB3_9HYPO|nr:sodium/calcium exchanger protein [Hirsutella rhossiliensis]KAH0962379.1 sodium/calcium exchanger protein [Hirsutella rhossiliensis]